MNKSQLKEMLYPMIKQILLDIIINGAGQENVPQQTIRRESTKRKPTFDNSIIQKRKAQSKKRIQNMTKKYQSSPNIDLYHSSNVQNDEYDEDQYQEDVMLDQNYIPDRQKLSLLKSQINVQDTNFSARDLANSKQLPQYMRRAFNRDYSKMFSK